MIAATLPRVGVNHKMPLFFTELGPTALNDFVGKSAVAYVGFRSPAESRWNFPYILLPEAIPSSRPFSLHANRPRLRYPPRPRTHLHQPLNGRLRARPRLRRPPFEWNEDRRALLRAELDAFYARAYGLTRDELRYILDPADVRGPDYPSETFRVLKTNEIARFGEYRTARLVLDAWDRMERGELT